MVTVEHDLAAAARELYAQPLRSFVSARDERARAAEDRSLGAAIRALRKPSIAAHVVNVFAQERAAALAEALELAQELREAQAELDAAALADLGRQRRALTRRLAEQAAELARERGEKVTAGTLDAVQQTISAAFFDAQAARAVASGRLVRELEPATGFGVDLDDAVGGGAVDDGEPPSAPVDELAQRRKRREAERRVQQAEHARAAAQREQRQATAEADEARRRIDECAEDVAEAERRLAHARQELSRAERAAAEEHDRAVRAAERAAEAETAWEKAKSALDRE